MLARFRSLWRLKLVLTAAICLLFWPTYSFLGRHHYFPLWMPLLTPIDSAVEFQPFPWAWVYLSQFMITTLVPWMLYTREQIRRCVSEILVLSLASFIIFLFLPVASPRPLGEWTGGMGVIAAYDGALDAFPSLHAGFLACMGLVSWRIFGKSMPLAACVAAVIWGMAILYSTLATRQHYVADLVAGVALGVAADWLSWRGWDQDAAAATIPRSSGVIFQSGSR